MADNDRSREREALLGRVIFRIEAGLLTTLFMLLLLLGLADGVLRQFTGVGLAWAEDAMNALVLWLTMVGAIVGAGRLKHLRFDRLEQWLSTRMSAWLRRLVFLSTAAICLIMTWYSLHAVALERDFSRIAFLDLPLWLVQLIVPVGFGIMAARFIAWGVFPPQIAASSSGTPEPSDRLAR